MAKNNLFLGTASGSVGDVVLMRRNGKQVARARVREIANPKSQGQATQRSVFAPVAKFYSPLSSVLETSFEGKSRAESYTEFLRRNIALAKENGWNNVKGDGFWPYPYIVSQGTLSPVTQSFYTATTATGENAFVLSDIGAAYPAAQNTWGSVSSWLIANRGGTYQNGDQLTIILVLLRDGVAYPVYNRVFIDTESTESIDTLFSFGGLQFSLIDSASYLSPNLAAGCCILSRYENGKWRRSSQRLLVSETLMEGITLQFADAVASYMQGAAATPVSNVYLNGATIAVGSITLYKPDNTPVEVKQLAIMENAALVGEVPTPALVAIVDGVNYTVRNGSRQDGRYHGLWSGSEWLTDAVSNVAAGNLDTVPSTMTDHAQTYAAMQKLWSAVSRFGGTEYAWMV